MDDPSAIIAQFADNMTTALSQLQQAGAQHFLVFNVIDNGLRPRAIILDKEAEALAISVEWNIAIYDALVAIGLQNSLFDSFELFDEIVADRRFTNVTRGCVSANCRNPDEFMWWDFQHPSAETHRMIAAAVHAQNVGPPLPPAVGEHSLLKQRRISALFRLHGKLRQETG